MCEAKCPPLLPSYLVPVMRGSGRPHAVAATSVHGPMASTATSAGSAGAPSTFTPAVRTQRALSGHRNRDTRGHEQQQQQGDEEEEGACGGWLAGSGPSRHDFHARVHEGG